MAASGVWVTCGAPLQSGDGWRVWYSWTGDDFTPAPVTVRTPDRQPQQSTQGPLTPIQPPGSKRRMGVSELRIEQATAGALYEVTIPEIGRPLYWRTLPSGIPGGGFSLLFGSCFWINDDRDGFYSAAVKELVQRERPVFKILAGDQLYMDVWSPLPDKVPEGLADKYERYWGDGPYLELLQSCPTLVTCDDHEFWNDFPQPQLQVPLSWDRYQPKTTDALREILDAYQTALNPGAKRWYTIAVGPVSFFVADTRSYRTRDKVPDERLMLPEQWDDLEAWAAGLKGPGVLVLPQPLMKNGGSKTDRTLLDFQESARFGPIFERPVHDILILTGDIHTGRLSMAKINGGDGRWIYEFVASPASRVTPYLPPWGQKASKLDTAVRVNRRVWDVLPRDEVPTTTDNNIGLIRIAQGRNGSTRFTLQLWCVRPYQTVPGRIFKRKPAKGAQPIHDPIELELR